MACPYGLLKPRLRRLLLLLTLPAGSRSIGSPGYPNFGGAEYCVSWCAGAIGDPHISFANGGHADFRGSHRARYAFISSPGYQFAPYFQEVDFWYSSVVGLKQLVHGTFMSGSRMTQPFPELAKVLVQAPRTKERDFSALWRPGTGCTTQQYCNTRHLGPVRVGPPLSPVSHRTMAKLLWPPSDGPFFF